MGAETEPKNAPKNEKQNQNAREKNGGRERGKTGA
jgi:hypothetical protein